MDKHIKRYHSEMSSAQKKICRKLSAQIYPAGKQPTPDGTEEAEFMASIDQPVPSTSAGGTTESLSE